MQEAIETELKKKANSFFLQRTASRLASQHCVSYEEKLKSLVFIDIIDLNDACPKKQMFTPYN